MTPWVFVAVAAAGGLGATARFALDGLIRTRTSGTFPWGTVIINITGSLVLGIVVGLLAGRVLTEEWSLIIGVGFLGGYTTFSTASFETVRLLQDRRWASALANGLGVLVAAVLAAGLGLWLGMHV